MAKFTLITCAISVVLTTMYPILSYAEEDINPIQAAWMLRSTLPKTIGKIQTIHELSLWCNYEETQPNPNIQPCQMVVALTKNSNELKESIQLVNVTLNNLRAEPQTAIVREHITVLETALKEIKSKLNP